MNARAHQNYGWYVVGVLVIAYTFSYVDRTILTLLVKPIRHSLGISDTQVSLLHGLAFAVFYTVLGIPIARLADSSNRVLVISAGIAVWSFMTALCGVARTFGQLFLARVGVGVGEAALGPAAYSLLSDFFTGPALTRALSVYTSAIYIGAGLALVIGGAIIAIVPAMNIPGVGHLEPWQVVFLFVGSPGLAIAVLMMTVREPPRTGVAAGAAGSLPVREVVHFMGRQRAAYALLIAGFSAFSLLWNGANAWIPTFFIRNFGWTPAVVGLRYGLVLLIFGTLGVIAGGILGGWLESRGWTDANPRVGIIASALIMPFGILAPLQGNPEVALALFTVFVFAGSLPFGAAASAFQQITPNQMRGQVTAVYFFFLNLAGIGLGPTVVALITDHVFHDDIAVKYSLVIVALLAAPLAALLLWLSLRPFRSLRRATTVVSPLDRTA
jgi:MFS family permease